LKIHSIALRLLPAVFLLFFLFLGCNKEPDQIGLDVQPPQDKLNVLYTDTIEILAFSEILDSIQTDEFTTNLLGSYVDPVFGKTTASIYTQIRLSDNNVDFGGKPVLDSIVLNLQYAGSYGYSSSLLHIKVFEIAEDFFQDSAYYSNQTIAHNSNLYFDQKIYPNPYDSVDLGGIKYPAELSLKLSDDLGNLFLSKSGQTELSDNDFFLEFFKGLYITVDPVFDRGTLLYFDLQDVVSNLTLYYHNQKDTLSYVFVINDKCARFNNFNHHDYTDASTHFKKQVLEKDTLQGRQVLYLQPLAGVRTKIFFKNLSGFTNNDQRIIINKAELFIKNLDFQPELSPPAKLSLARINEEGTNEFITDQFDGDIYFGGTYESASMEYRFRISRHIQQILNGELEDYGLSLMVSGSAVLANRLVLLGTHPDLPAYEPQRLRLHITYTRLN